MDIGLVCSGCDFLNDTEAAVCTSCGAALNAEAADNGVDTVPTPPPIPEQAAQDEPSAKPANSEESSPGGPPPSPSLEQTCPNCGATILAQMRFCGGCGSKVSGEPDEPAPVASRTLFFGQMQAPNRAKLVLIKGEGMDGVSYHLNATEHYAGREQGEIRFLDDRLLSPKHACFYYDQDRLMVRDEQSTNGIFVRITGEVPIRNGAHFLVGEQLIRFEELNEAHLKQPKPDPHGTYVYGSPLRPAFFKLSQILRGGHIGMLFRAASAEITLGREANDINFPDDPFISGQHAMVRASAESFALIDLGSKNGTFLRVEQPYHLQHGDYVFLGQQLMRVEIT